MESAPRWACGLPGSAAGSGDTCVFVGAEDRRAAGLGRGAAAICRCQACVNGSGDKGHQRKGRQQDSAEIGFPS